MARQQHERGAAVPEFVLVLLIFIPLALGIMQVGITMQVSNTLTAAASEGARAGAPLGATAFDAEQRTRTFLDGTMGSASASIQADHVSVAGVESVRVQVRANLPALGFFPTGIELHRQAHAIRQIDPG